MSIYEETFGSLPDGREILRFQIQNKNGIIVSILNYGGIIQSILTPDRNGAKEDIVLGYDTAEEYVKDDCCFGATIGRVANRIAGASLELAGNKYLLTANEGDATLHGGSGFHKKLWDYEVCEDVLILRYTSPDGEDGFPGTLKIEQTITLSDDNVLRLEYAAVSDRTTVCSLTGHSYFNLCGASLMNAEGTSSQAKTVADHQLQIAAKEYTPTGDDLIPTGEICPVSGTPYDFLGARNVGNVPLDGNLVLSHGIKKWDGRLYDPASGRFLSVRTSLPGLQVYNGTGITLRKGKGGIVYNPQTGLCLEPQFYPDAVHHPQFPQPVLQAGEEYRHYIEYRFGVV